MGTLYTLSRSNTALSTTADWITILSAAARSLRVREIGFGGMATASAANEIAIARHAARAAETCARSADL